MRDKTTDYVLKLFVVFISAFTFIPWWMLRNTIEIRESQIKENKSSIDIRSRIPNKSSASKAIHLSVIAVVFSIFILWWLYHSIPSEVELGLHPGFILLTILILVFRFNYIKKVL